MKTKTAHNERFCVIAAVSPQIMQWELASYCPATSSVEAATTQSRHHVRGNAATAQWDSETRKQERYMTVKLRKWNEADLDSLVKYANNINVAKWLTNGFPYPYTYEDGKAFLTMIANDNPTKIFAIDVNGEAVGSIGIFPQADIHEKSAETGYWLAEQYWGKGIMTTAILEIVEYGFSTFDIVRIFARPFSTNPKSHRVLEKAGFLFEARLKSALFKNGEFMDEMIYAKLKD